MSSQRIGRYGHSGAVLQTCASAAARCLDFEAPLSGGREQHKGQKEKGGRTTMVLM